MSDASESFDPYYKWLGIPPRDQPPNHYRLLGVDLLEEDPEVIEAAANRQMTYIQGCASGPHIALSQRLLNEIAKARLALLDPSRKKAYDQKLRSELAAASAPTAGDTLSSLIAETDFPAAPTFGKPAQPGSLGKPAPLGGASDVGTPVTVLGTLPGAYGDTGAQRESTNIEVQEKRVRKADRGPTKVSINWRFPAFIILAIVLIVGGITIATQIPKWLKLPQNKPAGSTTTGKSRP